MPTSLITLTANSLAHRVVLCTPKKWKRDGSKAGVILIPGTDETYTFPFLSTVGQPLIKQFLDAGHPVLAFQASSTVGGAGNLWANDACYAMIAAARTYLQSTAVGAKSGKVILSGLSQGTLDVLAWAGENPSLVAAITGYLPNTDLAATAQAAGYSASVASAYGGSYVQGTHGPTHNPITQASAGKFSSIPSINLVYANNDSVIAFSYPQAFKTAVGNNVTLIDGGATGHNWPVTWTNQSVKTALANQLASYGN